MPFQNPQNNVKTGGNKKQRWTFCLHLCFLFIVLLRRSERLCVDVGVGGVLLDELAAWLHVVAHEH